MKKNGAFEQWGEYLLHVARSSLVLLILIASAPVLAAQHPMMPSPQQQDHLIIGSLLKTDAPYEFAAIAYAVWGAGTVFDNKGNTTVELWNPAPPTIVGQSRANLLFPVQNRIQYLKRAANQQANSIEALEQRGLSGEALLQNALGITGQEFGFGPTLVLPAPQGAGHSTIQIDTSNPGAVEDIARDASDWGLDQVRRGSEEGKILLDYVTKWSIPDPRHDRSSLEPIKAYMALAKEIAASRDLHQMIEKNSSIASLASRANATLAALKQPYTSPPPFATERKEGKSDQTFFRDTSDSLETLSYTLALTDHSNEAQMVGKLAQASKAMEVLSTAGQMSPLAAANVYLYAGVLIYSAIKVANEPASPYPAIFSMLAQISKQIEQLRQELGTRLNQIDTKLGDFVAQSLPISETTLSDVVAVTSILETVQKQLDEVKASSREQFFAISDLVIAEENANCFNRAAKGRILALSESKFVSCRDILINRGTSFARSVEAPLTDNLPQAPAGKSILFPYAGNYEDVRRIVDPRNTDRFTDQLADPAIWEASATYLINLVRYQPGFLRDLEAQPDEQGARRLYTDGLVKAGEDLERFRRTLLFTRAGLARTLRADRLQLLVDRIAATQAAALGKIATGTANLGGAVDPTKGFDQPYNQDYQFLLLAQPLPYCANTVRPRVLSYVHLMEGFSGDAHGHDFQRDTDPKARNFGRGHREFSKGSAAYLRLLDGNISGVAANELGWDKQILPAIAKELLLLEQSNYLGARVSVCIARLDMENFDQDPSMHFTAKVDLELKVFLSVDQPAGRVVKPVQELAGSVVLHGVEGGVVIMNNSPRINAFFVHNWKDIRGQWGRALQDVSDDNSKANRQWARDRLEQFFAAKRNELFTPLLSALKADQDQFVGSVAGLEAAIAIGLDENQYSVRGFQQQIASTCGGLSPAEMAQRVVQDGASIEALKNTYQGGQAKLKSYIKGLADDPNIHSAPDPLETTMKDLEQFYWRLSVSARKQ